MEVDTEEIYKWIDTYQFTRPKRNISRDFSDAVPLAEILKYHFPKLVDLHNYTPKNAVAQKVINWMTLQRKVLSKLKINLTKNTLEDLARAEVGVIERVLFDVKAVIDKSLAKDKEDNDFYVVEGLDEEITGSVFPIKMKNGSKISDRKIVTSEIFDDMLKQISSKDETITKLTDKVDHLEKMIVLKDERIEDLQMEIKKLRFEDESTHSTTRFLNNLF